MESEVGKGTVFTVSLPLSANRVRRGQGFLMSRSVLIIDDEPLMRVSMLDALLAEGFEVQEASNGEEGIQKIQTGQYDVVITDLKMPGSDGLQVVAGVQGAFS